MSFACEFPIRFGDIDYARVVYFPRFFHIFHQTFEEWFGQALGVSYPDLVNKENIGFPSVKVETEFVAPVHYGDRVRVELELAELGTRSITCRYTMARVADEVIAARATIKTVAVDNNTFKSMRIPDRWRERFERFMKE